MQAFEGRVVGVDPYLQGVAYLEALRCAHLHAATGQVQTYRCDHLAGMQQADFGVDAHANEVAFLTVVGGRVWHAASF
ncbi:hypothetical protein D3C80_1842300 [compost metagenome]